MLKFNVKNSTIGQMNDSGDNIQLAVTTSDRKTFWRRLSKCYWLLATTIGLVVGLVAWYVHHIKDGIWFFWLK